MLINKNGIYYRKWEVKKTVAIILAIHGMGAHSERYSYMAEFLKTKKISTYSIALRGYGDIICKNPAYVPSLKVYCEDIKKLKEIIIKENPGKPIFILGESMGALIAHLTVLFFDSDYAGLIEVAPVYKDVMNMSLLKRIQIAFYAFFKPKKIIEMPFTTEKLTRDKNIIKKLNKDKKESRVASANLLLQILLNQIKIALFIKKIEIPTLFLLAEKDMLGSTEYNIKLFNKLKCEKQMKIYKNSYHALTIEKNRKEVFKDIYLFLKKFLKGGKK